MEQTEVIQPLTFRIDSKNRGFLQRYANARHLKLADIIREAILEYIGTHNLHVLYKDPNGKNDQG